MERKGREVSKDKVKNKRQNTKKINKGMKYRLLFTLGVITVFMIGLVVRMVNIWRNEGQEYSKKVLDQQSYNSQVIPYQRGDIYDRNGELLATSIKVYNLILDPKIMTSDDGKYLEPTLEALNTCFGYDVDEIRTLVEENSTSSYYIYEKKMTYSQIKDFQEMQDNEEEYPNIQGVWFETEYERQYPKNSLASSVIGFTSAGNVGTWGIEEFYNDYLNGTDGRKYGYMNSDNVMEETVKDAVDGSNVISTIDVYVQNVVETQIKKYMEEYQPDNIGVIVMKPNTGEILAMSGKNMYDLNNPRDLTSFYTAEELAAMDEKAQLEAMNKIWRNYCISDSFEPGSTAKMFTIAAALDEDSIQPDDTYMCDGYELVGGWTIRCHRRSGHGELTIEQAIAESCNDSLMQIGDKLGANKFVEYQSLYNIGIKTGIDLPGEQSCENLMFSAEDMGPADLATNTFGQNYNVTMIQLASAFCSLINGGNYYQPYVVKEIVNSNGGVEVSNDKTLIKQVITEETSDIIKAGCKLAVEDGTAGSAKVDGYVISGKTGTAEKLPRGTGEYLISFIGFAPYDTPEVVCYTVIDNPQMEGGVLSIPAMELFSDIMTEILPYLNVFPATEETDQAGSPNAGEESGESYPEGIIVEGEDAGNTEENEEE
ncbi:MAG: penicillin-binding protein 2 [Lachnospiraceae bacterium]|nr:penicillin-binding protein 2 [Lachnospiraceae bacterium]